MGYTIEKVLSKNNLETIRVNNLFLHSKFNPIQEANKFVENKYAPHQLHVVFGYGLGYIVEELIKLMKFNEPILIIDPLIDEKLLSISNHNYERLYYVNSEQDEQIIDMLDQLASYTTKVQFISSINYEKLFPTQVRKLVEYIHLNQYKQAANITTAKRYAHEWQKNLVLNTLPLSVDASLEVLKGKYDAPVVIAAGGPSLIKQLELVKTNREKFILICAGSTINALVQHQINPDYIVSVDGGVPNAKHFEQLQFDDSVSLIYSPTNHYKVRKSFSGNCYGFIPKVREKLDKYYSKRIGKKLPLIDGGGSVAHFAYAIAKYISTGPIAFIGQDLAYTNNASHAEGVKGNKKLTNTMDVVYVDGYYGEQIATSPAMRIMLNTFNDAPLFDNTRKNIWNCTEGGAKIHTIPELPFQQFIETYSNEAVLKIEPSNKLINGEEIVNQVQEELNGYQQVLSLLNQGIQLVNEMKMVKFSKSELNKLGKIEKHVNELFAMYSLETLLEPVFDRCMKAYLPSVNETELQTHSRIKEYTFDLYSSCIAELEKFINEINVEELKYV